MKGKWPTVFTNTHWTLPTSPLAQIWHLIVSSPNGNTHWGAIIFVNLKVPCAHNLVPQGCGYRGIRYSPWQAIPAANLTPDIVHLAQNAHSQSPAGQWLAPTRPTTPPPQNLEPCTNHHIKWLDTVTSQEQISNVDFIFVIFVIETDGCESQEMGPTIEADLEIYWLPTFPGISFAACNPNQALFLFHVYIGFAKHPIKYI